MKTFAGFLFLISSIFMIGTDNAQSEDLDQLLDKVHQRMSSHPDSLFFTSEVQQTTYFMDKKWQPKKTIIIEKIRHRNGLQIDEEIKQAIEIENGKEVDITNKQREEAKQNAENKGNKMSVSGDKIFPFSPEARKNYQFKMHADSVWNNKPVHVIYAEGQKVSSDFYRGNYYIDSESFDVLGVDVRPAKNPKFVKNFHMRMSFTVVPEGFYVLEKYWMKVYANILIKKIRMIFEEENTSYQFK
jgi:hypothetical protein